MIVLRLVRLLRKVRQRKHVGFTLVLLMLGVALLGNAACFYVFDRAVDDSITIEDALWYSVISITTIGYGDFSAQTTGARLGTVLFIVVIGLGTFSVFLGMLIDWATTIFSTALRGLGRAMASDHVLVVHFPNRRRVQQILDELRGDPLHRKREIVLVNDQLDELPFSHPNVIFVRGSTLDPQTYERARIGDAAFAIVLSHDYQDSDSDAVVASAARVIDSIKPEIHLVAECLDDRHRSLFDAVNCDAVVSGMTISGNLLVQESRDPGVAQTISMVTTSRVGTTLYSTRVDEAPALDGADGAALDYRALAKRLLDDDITLFAVNRGGVSHTALGGLSPAAGDVLVYVAGERLDWAALRRRATAD
ncbi:potassium channel family protein [Haliangium ochraceum]|uniref:Ion transport 2 domain protein n=1 Tax=Haliangium ochraceum (strain DSM 14365 / JCM 11303 / SMP-2) TaxID=502025 RepID=D0LN95_HALO1|nr:potassium channel family protein [Haliangium ochraceum]ACY15272.1 Ion transport 2 domain protein [Haliangium ochraceum DSM 14365]